AGGGFVGGAGDDPGSDGTSGGRVGINLVRPDRTENGGAARGLLALARHVSTAVMPKEFQFISCFCGEIHFPIRLTCGKQQLDRCLYLVLPKIG
ncbi:MAG: hypothetical protein WBN04_00130, partial [Paracoccaceae bacterium]